MATSAKHFVLLFLLALLSFNLTQARQSQFFSKVATIVPTSTVTPSTNAKDAAVQVSDNGLQNQPNFIQDSQTGYGLYDHGTGQLPPDSDSDTSKTPTSFPYTAAHVQPDTFRKERLTGTSLMDQGYPTTTYNNDETYMTNPEGNNNEYVNEQQGLSGTSLMDRRSPAAYNNQAYVTKQDEYGTSNNNKYYNKYEYANGQQGFSGTNTMDSNSPTTYYNNNNNNEYANEQQGFSGTSLMDRNSPTAYNNQAYITKPDGYDSTSNNNNYIYNYENGVNTYNSQQPQQEFLGDEKYLGAYNNKNTNYYNTVNNAGYNVQQQGMSDTRFMENGKYYYDVKKEYNYNPNGLDHYSNNGYSRSNINGNSQNQDSFNP